MTENLAQPHADQIVDSVTTDSTAALTVAEPTCLQVWRDDPQTFSRSYQEVLQYIDALRTKLALADQSEALNADIHKATVAKLLEKLAAADARNKALTDALRYWRDECSGNEPSLSVFNRMVDELLKEMK